MAVSLRSPAARILFPLVVIAGLLVASSCCLPTRIRYGVVPSRAPLWKVDLRKSGFYLHSFAQTGVVSAVRQISFGSEGELVVISDGGSLPGTPNQYRAFALDAQSGTILAQRSWVGMGDPEVFGTTGGNYIVSTFNGMALYAPSLDRIIATLDDWPKMISPDGREVTVWGGVPGRAVTTFLDADTLRPTGAEFINKNVDSIAPGKIVYVAYKVKRGRYASVFVEDRYEESESYDTYCSEVRPRFISRDVLAVFGCDRLEVISAHGRRLFSTSVDEWDHWLTPAARNGKRFALISTYESAAHWSKPCFERVRVFDVETGKMVFKTEIREVGGSEGGGSGVALSPDGDLLAVNSLGVVQMFRLPPLEDAGGPARD